MLSTGDVVTLDTLRVPYGVISNREGKGALPGEYPQRFRGVAANEPYFNQGGNISVFAAVDRAHGRLRGRLPGDVPVGFDLAPFMGTMGVARDTSGVVDSASDFQCSQVVGRTTGIHALNRKADFA